MATADGTAADTPNISLGSIGEASIAQRMAELADAISGDDIDTTTDAIAAYLNVLSPALPESESSIGAGGYDVTPLTVESVDSLPISFANSRFETRRVLGQGGFGVVLLAFDRRLNREVALKVPRPEVLVSPNIRQQFLREAQAAA